MKNSEMPAQPQYVTASPSGDLYSSQYFEGGEGLTKLEYACIHCGVPETGDPDLDAIIAKGNEYKHNIQNFERGEPNYDFNDQLIMEALDRND